HVREKVLGLDEILLIPIAAAAAHPDACCVGAWPHADYSCGGLRHGDVSRLVSSGFRARRVDIRRERGVVAHARAQSSEPVVRVPALIAVFAQALIARGFGMPVPAPRTAWCEIYRDSPALAVERGRGPRRALAVGDFRGIGGKVARELFATRQA